MPILSDRGPGICTLWKQALPGLHPDPGAARPPDRVWICVPRPSAALCQTPAEAPLRTSPLTAARLGRERPFPCSALTTGPTGASGPQEGPPSHHPWLLENSSASGPGPGARGEDPTPVLLSSRLLPPCPLLPPSPPPPPPYLGGENPARPTTRPERGAQTPSSPPSPPTPAPRGRGQGTGDRGASRPATASPGGHGVRCALTWGGGRATWGRGEGGPEAANPPATGRAEAGGANGTGGSPPGGGRRPSPSLHARAPPLPGLKRRGRRAPGQRARSGAGRCAWARRRHHAPRARAGPGRALPAGAARRRRRRLLRVSVRRTPGRAPALPPALPPAAAGPAFPSRCARPRLGLELRPHSGRAQPHLRVGGRATYCVSRSLGSDPIALSGVRRLGPLRRRSAHLPRPRPHLAPSARSRTRARRVQVPVGAPMPAPVLTRGPVSPSWPLSSHRLCLGLPLHPPPLTRGAETQRPGGGEGAGLSRRPGEGIARAREERRKPGTGRSVRCRPRGNCQLGRSDQNSDGASGEFSGE